MTLRSWRHRAILGYMELTTNSQGTQYPRPLYNYVQTIPKVLTSNKVPLPQDNCKVSQPMGKTIYESINPLSRGFGERLCTSVQNAAMGVCV